MITPDGAEEQTKVVLLPASAERPADSLPAIAGAAELVSLATLDDEQAGRTWFEGRLHAFAAALLHDQSGARRGDVERRALGDAARDMIERLVSHPEATASDWPQEATLQPGQLLANTFYVRALLARGGVGEIYRVRHRDLRTEYAVKVLQPQHTLDTTIVSMLLEEARHLTCIRHAGVVAGHGALRDTDGRLLMVMELVRGRTLAARLREGPLSPSDLMALATALLHALDCLHQNGIVHGDLSPDNIMLEEDRCAAPKIIDFGLAHTMGEAEDMAILVDFAGKFSWVSPEQLADGHAPIDGRADLYSLGLVLAAALRGRRLDMGSDRPSAKAARRSLPPLDDMPAPWGALLRVLLSPNPHDRPQSAAAVLDGLVKPARRPLLDRFRRRG